MTRLFLYLLTFYQGAISPFLGARCRYVPSCSEYMKLAIEKNGAVRGFVQGLKRFLRCAPWSSYGFDPHG